jgi:uncharacterized DUF497 family protein
MAITFDPAKDAANIAKHGVSLSLTGEMELSAAVIVIDDRKAYGEARYLAFGLIAGRAHCLVFTVRGVDVRVISLRRANRKEVTRYKLT